MGFEKVDLFRDFKQFSSAKMDSQQERPIPEADSNSFTKVVDPQKLPITTDEDPTNKVRKVFDIGLKSQVKKDL